jgi:hypothetical protein
MYRASNMRLKGIYDLIFSIRGLFQRHKLFCFHTRGLFPIFMLWKSTKMKKKKQDHFFTYLIGSKRNFGIAESHTR